MEGDYVKPLYLDVEVKGDGEWAFETEEDSTLFIYILQGEGSFDPQSEVVILEKHAILFNGGKTFWVKASNQGIRFILLSGKPLKEPIAWGGPIVMNTKQELDQAFKDLNEDKFVQ